MVIATIRSTEEAALLGDHLPFDVLFEILSRLPVTSLLRCRCINKQWCAIIDGSCFINAHLQRHKTSSNKILCEKDRYESYVLGDEAHHPLDHHQLRRHLSHHRSFSIRSSCDGLLCLQEDEPPHCFHVLNIATRRLLRLLPPPSEPPSRTRSFELVRDPSSTTHKLVLVHDASMPNGEHMIKAEILTLTGTRRLEMSQGSSALATPAVVVDGACHWVTSTLHEHGTARKCTEQITALRITEETASVIPLPRSIRRLGVFGDKCACLAEIGGFLHLIHFDWPGRKMDLWKLLKGRTYDGNDGGQCWLKLKSVNLNHAGAVLDCFRSEEDHHFSVYGRGSFQGKILMKVVGSEGPMTWPVWATCDIESGQFEELKRRRDSEDIVEELFVYVESLCPLE